VVQYRFLDPQSRAFTAVQDALTDSFLVRLVTSHTREVVGVTRLCIAAFSLPRIIHQEL
jgi:regulator of protease activity HflC (stomatin/prohibitin superfamily)